MNTLTPDSCHRRRRRSALTAALALVLHAPLAWGAAGVVVTPVPATPDPTNLVQAGAEARVTAQISPPVIKLGGRAVLRINAENADGARVVGVPQVDGIEFGPLHGPSRQSQVMFVGGRRTSYVLLTWEIELRPTRADDFEIPPITVRVGDRDLLTQPVGLTASRDLRGEDLGFLEVEPSSGTIVEGQPFSVRLRFGWIEALGSRINFADLSLPWIDQLPGVLELDVEQATVGTRLVEISLNRRGRVSVNQVAPTVRDGRRFVTYELTRHYLASRPGRLEFGASALEFSHVSESGSFFRNTTQRAERNFVRREPFTVEVGLLPEEGRPLDFTGAVGQLRALARTDRRDVDAGESIKLTVEWTGTGNLEFFDLPDPSRMDAFGRFRVYGAVTTDKRFDQRTAVYDLAPLDPSVSQIPPLPLRVFDPEHGQYVTVATEPIPIRVRALAGAARPADELEAPERSGDVGDIETAPLSEAASDQGLEVQPREAGGALAGILGLWLFGRFTVRKRRGNPDGPRQRRRRRARSELARELTRGATPAERLAALQGFLAARTDEAPIDWVGRDAARWATERGAPPAELADELARALAELERAAWAPGESPGPDGAGGPNRSELLHLADRLTRGGLQ